MSPPDEPAGLAARVQAVLAGLIEIVATRIELAGSDIELQLERLRSAALLALAGLLLLALALIFGSAFVIVIFWETYRLAAIGGVTLVYAAAGIACLLVARRRMRDSPKPFEATIAELQHDLSRLRR